LTILVEDPDARGFAVYAPGMKYTDLGTEFGVFVAKDGSQEMHVFRGKVQAEAGEPDALASGNPQTPSSNPGANVEAPSRRSSAAHSALLVLAHDAIRIAAPGKPIEDIAANEKQFVRKIPVPESIPLFNTGIGLAGAALAPGEADPHWSITAVSTDPGFQPRPAIIADPPYRSPDTARWISISRTLGKQPGVCRWTYCTHFDLSRFDGSTARVSGRMAADHVVEYRLNGHKTPLEDGGNNDGRDKKWIVFEINRGFVPGDNTLEFVIENPTDDRFTVGMAIFLECNGTALPLASPRSGQ
jgi:hypothetical protein